MKKTIKKTTAGLVLMVFVMGMLFVGFNFPARARDNLGRLEPVSVKISCEEFRARNHIRKTARLAEHGRLEVTLCSNPSTGYEWSDSAQISNHTVLWQTSHMTLPSTGSGVGSPTQERWVFQGLNEGQSKISLEYGRSWEGSGNDGWRLQIDVTVVDDDEKVEPETTGKSIGEKLVREIFQDIAGSNISSLEKKMSKEFQSVHGFGISDYQGEIETLKGIKLNNYTLANFHQTRQNDTLIVSYTVKAEESIRGEEVDDEPVPRLSVFVKTDSGWKWVAHANLSEVEDDS